MDSSLSETPREYSRTTICNRSLSPVGRIVFLALIFSNILIVAAGFAFVGAWVVLPFAGVEIVALGLAFYLVSLRDGDFERLTINNLYCCCRCLQLRRFLSCGVQSRLGAGCPENG